jgi:hypothetical protein
MHSDKVSRKAFRKFVSTCHALRRLRKRLIGTMRTPAPSDYRAVPEAAACVSTRRSAHQGAPATDRVEGTQIIETFAKCALNHLLVNPQISGTA